MRLQTILFPTEDICDVKEMYFHERGEYVDFDGYFNLFQITNRRHYTDIEELYLCVELKGYEEIILMNDKKEIGSFDLEANKKENYKFKLPYDSTEGVFWFSLKRSVDNDGYINGYYDGIADCFRDINIVFDICTYKREQFVERNLKRLASLIENKDLEVSDHLSIYIIDNGKTLSDQAEIQNIVNKYNGRITVFENKNAGGASGFTRGMIEALHRKQINGLTHILLMDDDASFDIDLFVRLYGVLSALKEEYKDIIVGGNVFLEERPYIQQVSGEWFEHCQITGRDSLIDLRSYDKCIKSINDINIDEKKVYSGWWCCCYSLGLVNKDNLPLPLFIHFDDIEYCIRNADHGIAFFNGIGVWHRGFDLLLPGANIYYDVRNNLITTALYGGEDRYKDSQVYILKMIISAVLRMKYKDLNLIYKGVSDFCKGPKWLVSCDAEKNNSEIRGLAYKTEYIDSYKERLTDKEYRIIKKLLDNSEFYDILDKWIVNSKVKEGHLKNILTFNGWILPPDNDKITLVTAMESPFAMYRKKKAFLMEPESCKGIVLSRRYNELARGLIVGAKTMMTLKKYYQASADSYGNNINHLTSIKTWESYLEI